MNSKKAMSPLVATVLVIAFAVALGVMIMNWGGGSHDDSHAVNYCKDVSVVLEQEACYSSNSLTLYLKNDGKERFDGIILKSVSDSGEFQLKIKDSVMIPRESLIKQVLFAYAGGSISLEIVPYIDVDGSAVACLAGAQIQSQLPSC
jgi:flagellin-like protein